MIYLDSAATTLQKPPEVAQASRYAIEHLASPGRGGHRPAMEAAAVTFACREAAARLFDVPTPEQAAFTLNATHALNLAVHTLVQPGDTVLVSGYEHNAVTRPLAAIPNVTIKVARAPLFQPEAMYKAFEDNLTPEVKAVICTHVSNVFGTILPMEKIAGLCRSRCVPLIIDASQSAGSLPVSLEKTGAAFIAMPGHKGLFGPQGTGLLLCSSQQVTPLMQGGTGSESMRQQMPDFLPDRLEAGTHNVAGIAGLLEGIRFVENRGTKPILAHEQKLIHTMADSLSQISGVEVFFSPENQAGVLSLRAAGRDCEELGELLGEGGYALRAGLHCAPYAHETAGTLETGTLRASVSPFNTEQEIFRFADELARLVKT